MLWLGITPLLFFAAGKTVTSAFQLFTAVVNLSAALANLALLSAYDFVRRTCP